jgi:TRAP transporter 4TM/12TM fusion protein
VAAQVAAARTLEALILLAVVGWILDGPRALGYSFYTEQLLALVLGLSVALAFLVYPKDERRVPPARRRVPWWDWLAAAAALGAFGYVAVRFDALVTEVGMAPREFVPLSIAIVLLVLETTRRATGMSLIWYTLVGVAYALWGHLLPGAFAAQEVTSARLITYLGLDTNALLGSALQVAVLVVIPFILLGQILARCGGSEFFTDLSMAVMGRYRGGAGKVAVTGSAFFGMISGSAVANVSAVGVVTIPLMKRAGFTPTFAAAVEAVGSTGGQLMPPVMGASAFLMADFLQIPYSAVVIAALIPAFMYYFSLFMQVDVEAAALGIQGTPRERLPALFEMLRAGWHFLLPFGVIIVGLLGYNMEAEYAALLACAALIASCFAFGYRGHRVTPLEMLRAIVSTGSAVLDVVLICGAAGVLIGVLNISGLAFGLTLHLLGLSGESVVVLLLLAAVIGILLGLGLPTVGVYVLMATLVAPSLVKIGVAPIAAHMFVMYFGMMSMVTPPIALAAYAAANIAQCDPDRAGWMATRVGWAAYLVPFLFVYDPPLLMQGSAWDIAWAVLTNCLGLWCGTIAVVGFYRGCLSTWRRVAFLAAGLALLYPAAKLSYGLPVNLAAVAAALALLLARGRAAGTTRTPPAPAPADTPSVPKDGRSAP